MAENRQVDAEILAAENYLGGSVPPVEYLRLHVARSGGQTRPQQEEMLTAVSQAIEDSVPLLVQAGTGTGKSLAYAFAAGASGQRTVIATATNQLGEQLVKRDLPLVSNILNEVGKPVSVALLKGRSNYVCKAKLKEISALGHVETEGLFSVRDVDSNAEAFRELYMWAESTESGDRSDGPPVSNSMWRQVSVSSSECAGRNCPFIGECFTEEARRIARSAAVVLTNHSLVAQDIRRTIDNDAQQVGAPSVFGDAPVIVVDEAHGFAETVTDAFSSALRPVDALAQLSKMHSYLDDSDEAGRSRCISELISAVELVDRGLERVPIGNLTVLSDDLQVAVGDVARAGFNAARELQQAHLEAAGNPRKNLLLAAALGRVVDYAAAALQALENSPSTVCWVSESSTGRSLNVAPIEVGPLISRWTELTERTLIATSATLTVGGSFEPMKRELGLDGFRVLDVGTPFDYRQQGILYVPAPPFPAPIGKDRIEHTERALREIRDLVAAAGGRSLVLFTTTAGALRGADTLRDEFPSLTVLCHGDEPADVLVERFREDENSVLCATMGMWHGVDVPGPSCSLVVVDKIPFTPLDDAISAARRSKADGEGRDGFKDVFVADAAIHLAQAAGRLIRAADDRGVVAILDPRIHTKSYGQVLLNSLPPFVRSKDSATVNAALTRLTGGFPDDMKSVPCRSKKKTAGRKSDRSRSRKPLPTRKRRPQARNRSQRSPD